MGPPTLSASYAHANSSPRSWSAQATASTRASSRTGRRSVRSSRLAVSLVTRRTWCSIRWRSPPVEGPHVERPCGGVLFALDVGPHREARVARVERQRLQARGGEGAAPLRAQRDLHGHAVGPHEAQLAAERRGLPAEARRQPREQEAAFGAQGSAGLGRLRDGEARDVGRQRAQPRLVEHARAQLLPDRQARPREVGQARAARRASARPVDDVARLTTEPCVASSTMRPAPLGQRAEGGIVGVHAPQPHERRWSRRTGTGCRRRWARGRTSRRGRRASRARSTRRARRRAGRADARDARLEAIFRIGIEADDDGAGRDVLHDVVDDGVPRLGEGRGGSRRRRGSSCTRAPWASRPARAVRTRGRAARRRRGRAPRTGGGPSRLPPAASVAGEQIVGLPRGPRSRRGTAGAACCRRRPRSSTRSM